MYVFLFSRRLPFPFFPGQLSFSGQGCLAAFYLLYVYTRSLKVSTQSKACRHCHTGPAPGCHMARDVNIAARGGVPVLS